MYGTNKSLLIQSLVHFLCFIWISTIDPYGLVLNSCFHSSNETVCKCDHNSNILQRARHHFSAAWLFQRHKTINMQLIQNNQIVYSVHSFAVRFALYLFHGMVKFMQNHTSSDKSHFFWLCAISWWHAQGCNTTAQNEEVSESQTT